MMRRGPKDLWALRAAIADDFIAACGAMYYINPRSTLDPETGETTEESGQVEGLRLLELYPEQRLQAEAMERLRRAGRPVRIVKCKPRQSGDSTIAEAWTFHRTYWTARQHALTVAHHETTTSSLYQMAQTFYNELPQELQAPLRKLNRKELSWDPPLGSSLIAQTAGYLDLGHGLTIHHAHLSEIDLWADPEIALEGILETVAMAPGTSIIIESKAQGADGWLHHFYKASLRGETGFEPLFTPWFKVPDYRLPVPGDFERTAEEDEWVREFGISDAQIAWYRAKKSLIIAKEPWGGDRKMRASYPFRWEEAFQSSGQCVFPDAVLQRQERCVRPPVETIRLLAVGNGDYEEVRADPPEADLLIWERPVQDAYYAIGVDLGDGVGKSESVCSVLKWPGYEQVAEWANKRVGVDETAFVTRWLAERWGGSQCLVIPEINKAGPLALFILQQLPGNYNVFRWRYLDKPGMEMSEHPKLGWQCVTGWSKILTADLRYVPAADVSVGDALLGCEEKPFTHSPRLAIQTVVGRREFTAPRLKVRLADGRETYVSTNHPFWVGRESLGVWRWMEAAKLRRGDLLKCLPLWEPLRTYDAGRLSAFLDGEGHLSQSGLHGLHLLVSQAEGPLAEEIRLLWPALGFQNTFRWLKHKDRPHRPVATMGVTRIAEVLRALGSLRPTRLLRTFADIDLSHHSIKTFESIPVERIRLLDEGTVIGLETSPDHTLIADGIVGHNTNSETKKLLAQVANLIFLRGAITGEGVVRSDVLLTQMRRCIDILPNIRWRAIGGLSDRIIAWLIALIGAFLEYEEGNVGGMIAFARGGQGGRKEPGWREPNSFDSADEVFESRPATAAISGFWPGDGED